LLSEFEAEQPTAIAIAVASAALHFFAGVQKLEAAMAYLRYGS
jgi:hypothetical protein